MYGNEANLKETLLVFKKLMDDCGIEFALAYGTLLGACRNECLLPWDRDIDVKIIPKNYEECVNTDIFGMLREASRRGFKNSRWGHEFIIDRNYIKHPEVALLPEKEQWREFLEVDQRWKIERFGMDWKCQDSTIVGVDGWLSVKGIHADIDTFSGKPLDKTVLYDQEFNVPPNHLQHLSGYYGENWRDVFCSYELWLKHCKQLRTDQVPQEVEDFMNKWKPLLVGNKFKEQLMTIEDEAKLIKVVFSSVEGPLFEAEGQFLYDSAKKVKDGVIVEIGSEHGRSTVCLALGSKAGHNVPVYSIDPRTGHPYTIDEDWIENRNQNGIGTPDIKYYTQQATGNPEFYDNIKKWKVDDIVIPISDYSELAHKNGLDGHEWNKDIGLLWIDADNRYNYIKLDIELWAKHVIKGGKILFHDYPFPGVKKAIGELVLGNPRYCHFRDIGLDPIFNVSVR